MWVQVFFSSLTVSRAKRPSQQTDKARRNQLITIVKEKRLPMLRNVQRVAVDGGNQCHDVRDERGLSFRSLSGILAVYLQGKPATCYRHRALCLFVPANCRFCNSKADCRGFQQCENSPWASSVFMIFTVALAFAFAFTHNRARITSLARMERRMCSPVG